MLVSNRNGMIKPSTEQERALELFLKQEGLRIDAYAGSGKTTTLRMLADSTSRRGLYLAFNRNIADAAKHSFPKQVSCSTSHSIAFRSVRKSFGYPEWKLIGALTPNTVVNAFRMPDVLTFRSGLALSKWSYCSALLESVKRFLQSDDPQLLIRHIPRYGCLEAMTDGSFEDFASQAIVHIQTIWEAMLHKTGGLPLGHDGYLRLWALFQPESNVDYILVDEAQDLNPVLLGVLRKMRCSVVYVGGSVSTNLRVAWRNKCNVPSGYATLRSTLTVVSFRISDRKCSLGHHSSAWRNLSRARRNGNGLSYRSAYPSGYPVARQCWGHRECD